VAPSFRCRLHCLIAMTCRHSSDGRRQPSPTHASSPRPTSPPSDPTLALLLRWMIRQCTLRSRRTAVCS
jgi:hypothetical protein